MREKPLSPNIVEISWPLALYHHIVWASEIMSMSGVVSQHPPAGPFFMMSTSPKTGGSFGFFNMLATELGVVFGTSEQYA